MLLCNRVEWNFERVWDQLVTRTFVLHWDHSSQIGHVVFSWQSARSAIRKAHIAAMLSEWNLTSQPTFHYWGAKLRLKNIWPLPIFDALPAYDNFETELIADCQLNKNRLHTVCFYAHICVSVSFNNVFDDIFLKGDNDLLLKKNGVEVIFW